VNNNYGFLINFECSAAEIVRTLMDSLGLITAVPLITAIALMFVLRADSLGKWKQILGPEEGLDAHIHSQLSNSGDFDSSTTGVVHSIGNTSRPFDHFCV